LPAGRGRWIEASVSASSIPQSPGRQRPPSLPSATLQRRSQGSRTDGLDIRFLPTFRSRSSWLSHVPATFVPHRLRDAPGFFGRRGVGQPLPPVPRLYASGSMGFPREDSSIRCRERLQRCCALELASFDLPRSPWPRESRHAYRRAPGSASAPVQRPEAASAKATRVQQAMLAATARPRRRNGGS
jgi:hypothetical protein